MFHNLPVPVLHLFILIVKFLSLYVDELNDDDDDDDEMLCSLWYKSTANRTSGVWTHRIHRALMRACV